MKCLSVSQPFADLIVNGKKRIELRNWSTRYRGEFLVHSPLKIKKNDASRLHLDNFVTGAIIGKAEIFDVKRYNDASECKKDYKLHHSLEFKKYGFMLKKAKSFRVPIPYRGKLGLFEANIDENINESDILMDIIDEEYRYQWIGRH